jgi:hypothetical protein
VAAVIDGTVEDFSGGRFGGGGGFRGRR